MKWQKIIPWIALSIVLSGCVPERYQWSPNGQWVTVLSDDGLRIADANGKLLPGKIDGVQVVSWYGTDSKRLLAARQIDAKTWDEVLPYLSANDIQPIKDAAEHVRQFAMAYDWATTAPGWEPFLSALHSEEKDAGRDTQIYGNFAGAIAIWLRDHSDDALRRKIPAERWKELAETSQPVYSIDVYDIDPGVSATSSAFNREATVMKSLQQVVELRPSPVSKAFLAMIQRPRDSENQDQQFCEVWLAPNDGRNDPIRIAEAAASYPDWSRDGRQVALVSPENADGSDQNGNPTLGTLMRLTVMGEDGMPLHEPTTEELAGLLCNEYTRVRCAADGRIIFSSGQVTLPCTSNDISSRQELFAIEPDKQNTVIRLLPRQSAEDVYDSAQYFEISPDGRFASIPGSDGRVCVVVLASGTVFHIQDQPISPLQSDGKSQGTLPTVPTWRNSDELTFAAPGDANHWTVLLWSMSRNAGKAISAAWPPALVVESPPSTQPSDAAATRP